MKILQERYNIQESDDRHIRCAAHVINLVVQSFLFGVDEAEDPDEVDYYEFHKHQDLVYDPTTDEEQLSLEQLSDDNMAPVSDDLDKAANNRWNSPELGMDGRMWSEDFEKGKLEDLEQKSALEQVRYSL